MKWTLIVNLNAAKGKAEKKWPLIESAFKEQNMDFDYYFTEKKGHAISLTSELAQTGKRNFVAVGGDGLLNEVINGICSIDPIPLHEFVVATIPVGTGCDWARNHRIPSNIKAAVSLLKNPVLLKHDVGKAVLDQHHSRYFINIAGLAFDAFVVQQTDKLKAKGRLGNFIYLYGLLKSLHKYPSAAFGFTIGEEERRGPYFCMNVGICKYSGGGMLLVPKAVHNDALFDVTVIEKMSLLEVIFNIRYLFNGKIYDHKKITHYRTREISIFPIENDIPLELDGELIGNIPVSFEMLKEQITVVAGPQKGILNNRRAFP